MQRLGARGRTQCYWPVGLVSMAISPPQALGYRRVLPTQDHELLLDYQGKLFLLRNNLTPPHRRASHATMLCNNVKDVRGPSLMTQTLVAIKSHMIVMWKIHNTT